MTMTEDENPVTVEGIIGEYNSVLKEAQKFNYLVRASELQLEECRKLEILKNKIKSFKYQAIDKGIEPHANLFFHFQCVINSFISVLKMWTLLKEQNHGVAWGKLIDAQEYISVAFRASDNHCGIEEYVERLYRIETTVFPEFPLYLSSAIVEKAGKCSICNKQFGDCEHIEGFVHMGRLCRRIESTLVNIDHVALVNQPQDKRCIIPYISTDEGKKRDYFTWRIFDEKINHDTKENRSVEGVVLNLKDLDFD